MTRVNQAYLRVPDDAVVGDVIDVCPKCGSEDGLFIHDCLVRNRKVTIGTPIVWRCAIPTEATAVLVRCQECRTMYHLEELCIDKIFENESARIELRADEGKQNLLAYFIFADRNEYSRDSFDLSGTVKDLSAFTAKWRDRAIEIGIEFRNILT
jgi:hypothetical protein